MPTRNVVLTEHHEQVIEELVKSGRYRDASEVMREGLHLVEQREQQESSKRSALEDAARKGFADLEEGRFVEIPADGLEDFVRSLGQQALDRFHGKS